MKQLTENTILTLLLILGGLGLMAHYKLSDKDRADTKVISAQHEQRILSSLTPSQVISYKDIQADSKNIQKDF